MDFLQRIEELDGVRTDRLGLADVDVVTIADLKHASPALTFDLLVDFRAQIDLAQHLREHAVAQAQRRVAKAAEVEALQQAGVDLRAADDDLRATRADAGHRFALGVGHLDQLVGKAADVGRGCIPRPDPHKSLGNSLPDGQLGG